LASQFFINLVDNSSMLDPSPINGAGYAVFGNVSSGTGNVTSIVAAVNRAFVLEGRHQPCARMLIHIRGVPKAYVIREPHPVSDREVAGVVDLGAIEAVFR
jgi:cyclophilin family peptidyl-prolyl cis-trans isomerase